MSANQPLYNNPDRAFQVAWIVYINGIEVPVTSVTTSCGVWKIPEAEITMIPDPIIQRLGAEDRICVQVFYCDYWMDTANPQFRLMFDGEIIAWSYVNMARGRAISFNCVDYIQIWTQLFFFFMSSIDDIGVAESGNTIGVNANVGVQIAGYAPIYPYSLFAQGLTGEGSPQGPTEDVPPSDVTGTQGGAGGKPLINRPIDFIYNVVRGMIDSTISNRSVPAANFFAPWARRTNFHKRFVALPYLETSDNPGIFPILRAVRGDFAIQAVAQLASQVGSAGSIWQMFQTIMQTLMMEISMIPTPSAVFTFYNTLNIGGPPFPVATNLTPTFLTNYLVKPNFFFGLPPSCNVFFPSQIKNLAYQENYATQPTRMYFSDESWLTRLNPDPNADPNAALGALVRDSLSVAHPEEVNIAAREAIDHPGANAKNILVYPEEFFKGPVVDRRPMPTWFVFLAQATAPTPAPVAPTTPPTPAPTDTTTTVSDVLPGDTDRDVFRLYAKYEYFKERYSRRSGGIELAFNPYPVPGFPCAAFDNRATQVDIFGYITDIRQTLSSSWSTQISYSYGRTFQEVFSLLRQQFAFENQTLLLEASERVNNIANRTEEDVPTTQIVDPVGAIAVGPPEPLKEIRDVIQNFDRAEAFYKTLFYRAPLETPAQLSETEFTSTAQRIWSEAFRNIATNSAQPRETTPPTPQNANITAPLNKKASFYYPDIIDLQDPETGKVEGIQLVGIDSTARTALLAIVDKMRAGTATVTDIAFITGSLQRNDMQQQVAGATPDPNITFELNQAELYIRGIQTTSNLRGNVFVTPTDQASELFSSYEAAMKYNARPICTLDEYITFTVESGTAGSGIKEGRVEPGAALLNGDPRTFPAPYYARIRTFRPGPPAVIPQTAITNTTIVTNIDGIDSSPDGAIPAPSSSSINGLPADFPERRADWDSILLSYKDRAINYLPPRS